jgi:hypothetical protein
MPHTHKKHKKKIPQNYTPIESSHCKVDEVVDAIFYSIKTNWMTKDEFNQIYKAVIRKLKND